MKKALTLAAFILGLAALAYVCQAKSTSELRSDPAGKSPSFSISVLTVEVGAKMTGSLFQMEMQKFADNTYRLRVHYSVRLAEFGHLLLRILFIAYLAFLFKKNFPLLMHQHA
jgi:hypothetical protein